MTIKENQSLLMMVGEMLHTNILHLNIPLLAVLQMQNESKEVILKEKFLVPSFTHNESPEDLFDIPFGYDAYINSYPKLERPQGYTVISHILSVLQIHCVFI